MELGQAKMYGDLLPAKSAFEESATTALKMPQGSSIERAVDAVSLRTFEIVVQKSSPDPVNSEMVPLIAMQIDRRAAGRAHASLCCAVMGSACLLAVIFGAFALIKRHPESVWSFSF